ncbi:transporter substrate-binding domain-containing protein [Rhizobium leguminosarum bv. viciae]|nr:transporter substrate-binding domain-containing protein [Rhizobium leguminosarum bv. viciae]
MPRPRTRHFFPRTSVEISRRNVKGSFGLENGRPEMRKCVTKYLVGLASGVALLGIAANAYAASACEGAELVQDGKLLVAYNGDMPGTGLKDGKLIGIDGKIMNKVAEKLGVTVEPQMMEWSAEIESVKSRRVDIMHGMMGWTEQRTKAITMTDPIYYGGLLFTQKKGTGIDDFAKLKGKRVGTLQGFGFVPELKEIGVDLRLYDTSDAAIRDLSAGRVDVLILDPPLIQYTTFKQPDLGFESLPIKEQWDLKRPSLTDKYQVVFGLSLEAPKLAGCINEAIADLWKSCGNLQAASEFGFSDRFWFTPPSQSPRRGVDRAQDWAYPKLGSCN